MRTHRLVDANGTVLIGNLVEARDPWTRTVGLLGRKHIDDDDGMLFKNCPSVHTYFMQMPIDVLFVDESWRVTRIVSELLPWKAVHDGGSAHIIEIAAGNARRASIELGALLRLS